MSLGYHVRLRARDDRVIAPTDAARRRLARVFLRVGASFGLLSFNAADTHSHAVLRCDRAAAGEFARRTEIALVHHLGVECGFQSAWIAPIHDQHHLRSTFWYILRQQAHHGLGSDPLHEASNLLDLLGLRPLGAFTAATVREQLPRTERARLLEVLGVSSLDVATPALPSLAAATASATALPDLRGNTPEAATARVAAVTVGLKEHATDAVAGALGLTPTAVRRLRRRPISAALVRAVQLQLSLHAQLQPTPLFVASTPRVYAPRRAS